MAPVQEEKEEVCKFIPVEGDPHPQKSFRLGMRHRPYDINAYKRVRTPATLAKSGKRTVGQTPTTTANKKTKVMEEIVPAATPSKSKPAAADSKMVASGSVTRSASKKSWQRRPKPAHSGVPVPDKLQKLIEKHKFDPNDSIF